MDWSALPYELEEAILGCLSLRELADVSTTCKRFDQVFRQEVAKEQKARCDLAIEQFGRKRLARIADTVNSFLNTRSFDPHSGEPGPCYCWMSEDGTLHAAEEYYPFHLQDQETQDHETMQRFSISEDGTLYVEEGRGSDMANEVQSELDDVDVSGTLSGMYSTMLYIHVSSRTGPNVGMSFGAIPDTSCFFIRPHDDEEEGSVALMQALLSGEFAAIVGEGRPLARVGIQWGDYHGGFTCAGLQAQIAPLLPLAQTYEMTGPGGETVMEPPRR
jgi:hypothetical protein